MRRKDREMPESFALEVLDTCEWAVLGMTDADGKPYAVPLSVCRKDNAIYFHCAKDGRKTDALTHCPAVCLSCVGDTRRSETEFTTEYESAYIEGVAAEVTEDGEKIDALRRLCERHTPKHMGAFDQAIAASLSRTAVWRIDITLITGKRKKYGADGKEMKFGRTE